MIVRHMSKLSALMAFGRFKVTWPQPPLLPMILIIGFLVWMNKRAQGQMGSGIGRGVAGGEITLLTPTDSIQKTGDKRVVDGIELEFQMVPETEAPAEMNVAPPNPPPPTPSAGWMPSPAGPNTG